MPSLDIATHYRQSGYADPSSVPSFWSATDSEHSAEGYDRLPISSRGSAELRWVLIATVGFWLIVAWAVWRVW